LASAIAFGEAGALFTGLGRGGKYTETSLDFKTLKSFAGNRARKGHLVEPRLKEAKLRSL
jgi:topoisomerase-4 subunit A